MIHSTEQNTTDFEKALYRIKANIYLCFGFWGDEVDHSLGNFHVLQKYFHKKIILFSEKNCVFQMPKKGEIHLAKESLFSIYPLTKTKFIYSKGLQYPLDEIYLQQGKMIGIRNRTDEEIVHWEILQGKSIGIVAATFREEVMTFIQNPQLIY